MDITDLQYERIYAESVADEVLRECADLYSQHYGKWSAAQPDAALAGRQIRLGPNKIRDFLPGKNAWIAAARTKGDLVGYAFVTHFPRGSSQVTWITQLVIHSDFQNRLVGSTLLHSIWGFSNHYAWGIASANPYAIRALEKATRRRCNPAEMKKYETAIRDVVSHIGYLKDSNYSISDFESVINSGFYQDLTSLPKRLENTRSSGNPWLLGNLQEGQEWIATTFNSQKQMNWTKDEQEKFMTMSSSIAKEAYERMPQDEHNWARTESAENEIEYILSRTGLAPGSAVLDWGCGIGRHALALARRGYKVVGIDFSNAMIAVAKKSVLDAGAQVEFKVSDCRSTRLQERFDAAICLYDVIGSFPDEESNLRILENLIEHVRPGGWIIIGVMSYDYMEQRATHLYRSRDVFRRLNDLPASSTMATSGEIFDPKFVLLDQDRHIAYRKEVFDKDDRLPRELIVCDRRYTLTEIRKTCEKSGLEVVSVGFVRAGNFLLERTDSSDPTKEILVIARKRLV